MYLEEWAHERAAGASAKAFAECWGIHRSTHWRWARSLWKKASRRPRLAAQRVKAVVELDRRYRSSWDVRAIAHVARVGKTSVAKILRAERGPRPKAVRPKRGLRTRFLARDVMWSSDFVELPDGRKLLKTLDERSRYRLGWDLSSSETAASVVQHARRIIERMDRTPLVWKFDHGSGFMSKAFQALLAEHGIAAYPIPPRAPWANGRTERDHQEIKNWLAPVVGKCGAELESEIDDGMLTLNFIKPRAVLNYRTSAKTYFEDAGLSARQRSDFQSQLRVALRGSDDERLRRRAIRTILAEAGLYEEWLQDGKRREALTELRR
ncbi:MAG: DDE-type integrase/transposase/recombinase [Elusimicrobiota bacterium]|nr:MAG: DDE-type integrase/transposase/recombinase [Elusimicrobiota bacterium]